MAMYGLPQTQSSYSKLAVLVYYLEYKEDYQRKRDNKLSQDQYSFGTSEKQACEDGQMASLGVQAESPEAS
jgi:hypothetical protein